MAGISLVCWADSALRPLRLVRILMPYEDHYYIWNSSSTVCQSHIVMRRNLSFLFCECPLPSADTFFSAVNTLFADLDNVKNIPTYLNFDNEPKYCLHHQSPKTKWRYSMWSFWMLWWGLPSDEKLNIGKTEINQAISSKTLTIFLHESSQDRSTN